MPIIGVQGHHRRSWFTPLLLAAVVIASLAAGCSSPTTPTPPAPVPTPTPVPTPPPEPDPPTLSCPATVTASTAVATGVAVSFTTPSAEKGKEPVTVACSPASGTVFPIGTTAVTCTATDALDRKATCSFNVTVSRLFQLTRTHFMAFGDSITAGEVSSPLGGLSAFGATKQVVVPSASYPTQLLTMLKARYTLQAASLRVTNAGVSGERAEDAVTRFAQAVNTERPEVVLLMHGYNNVSNGATLSATALQVNTMAAEARNRGARVYLAALVPSRQGLRLSRPNSTITAFNDRLRDVARGEGAVFVDLYGAMIAEVDRYIGMDGLHPNEAGYLRIAEVFLESIRTTLEVP